MLYVRPVPLAALQIADRVRDHVALHHQDRVLLTPHAPHDNVTAPVSHRPRDSNRPQTPHRPICTRPPRGRRREQRTLGRLPRCISPYSLTYWLSDWSSLR
eukprot:909291-Rhodomonas_salina.1